MRRPRLHTRLHAPLAAALAALVPAAAGCASTAASAAEPEPYHGALLEGGREDESFGYYLTELDARLRAWSNYKLSATSREDKRTLRLLEQELSKKARNRFEELLAAAETGAPKNRSVAAMALGFTGRPEAQSALLGALASNSDDDLVGNALIGLGLLALPDTPLSQVCWLLGNHPDPFTRANAAYCLQRLVDAGAREDCVAEQSIDALLDAEPGVRAQAAATLGLLGEASAVDELSLLLEDAEPLVVAASARALTRIGRTDPHAKGDVARALVAAYEHLPRRMQGPLLIELMHLAEANYGDDIQEWRDWAYRLD